MNIIDNKENLKNHKVAKDSILLLQGQREKSINILHSGIAEVLVTSKKIKDPSPLKIINESRRVGLIKGETVYGIIELHSELPYGRSVKAITDCVITVIPASDQTVFEKFKNNMKLTIQILRAIIQGVESSSLLHTKYKDLYNNLIQLADVIALALPQNLSDENSDQNLTKRTKDNLSTYSINLKNKLSELNIEIPDSWDINLFTQNIQKQIKLIDDSLDFNLEDMIDYKQYLFFKRFLRVPAENLHAIFSKDEPISFYIYQFLTNAFEPIVHTNEEIADAIYDLIEVLFGKNGWIEQGISYQKDNSSKAYAFNHYLYKYFSNLYKVIQTLIGKDLLSLSTINKLLSQYSSAKDNILLSAQKNNIKEQNKSHIQTDPNIISKFNNLLEQILQYANISNDFRSEFLKDFNRFKSLDNQFENESTVRKLREKISNQYWKLYSKCFLKIRNSDLKEFIPGIMLHFGVLDETLLTNEQLAYLDTVYHKRLFYHNPIPVMTLPYFLKKINDGEIGPSMTELGQTFKNYLSTSPRSSKKNKSIDSDVKIADTNECRLDFEANQVISTAYRTVFGTINTAFPILCNDLIVGDISNLILEPKKLMDNILKFRDIDFSMFYRETVAKLKYGNEIIKQEILPNFVLYPITGSKIMMWQEIDGTSRYTQGRFFAPIYFNGNLDQILLTAIAHYRWELQRQIAGANWMDPVEGGMTGIYYDYITYFQKNPNLSLETKDKLKDFVKKLRTERDRFAADYLNWMEYEHQGIPKLNRVAREIFYKFCPFHKADRDNISKFPAFDGLEMKYENIKNRIILKIESRTKKYMKAGATVPPELIDYLHFLKL